MLDEHGFKRKNFAEVLDEMSDTARELFGADVNVSSTSPLGIILRVVAWFVSKSHESAEKVYHSGFVSQAQGVSLDRLGANFGITRNPNAAAIVALEFEGRPGFVIGEGVQFQTESQIIFQMIDVVTLDADGRGSGQAVSQVWSRIGNVPANTITTQTEPTDDITVVTNPEPANGGAEVENDVTYRNRIRMSVNSNPGPPVNGILSALLAVPGVLSAYVSVNNLMSTDSYGNPPKSVRAMIDGGNADDIADALFGSIAAGIETVGSQMVYVKDVAGHDHEVRFDYAERIPIHMSIEMQVNSVFQDGQEQQLRQGIADHINSLGMGRDVLYTHLFPVIYQIPGIVVAVVKVGRDVTLLNSNDIDIKPYESAVIGEVDISVG